MELAVAPRDPYRVLELLTLPIGPFQGRTGGVLARALREAPGIGGRAWLEARASITDPEQLVRVVEWLEVPGHDREDGAPREAMLAVANRVRTWVQGRLGSANAEVATNLADAALAAKADMLGAAYAQVQSFHEALAGLAKRGKFVELPGGHLDFPGDQRVYDAARWEFLEEATK